MRTTVRTAAALCAVIAIAALTVTFASGDTEPLVRDIVLDGAIGPPVHEPEATIDDVADAPRTGVEVEQIQPAPTVEPPTPALEEPVVVPPLQQLPAVPPAVILVPPAQDPSDVPDEDEPPDDDDTVIDDDDPDD